jgi:hypothetical protein
MSATILVTALPILILIIILLVVIVIIILPRIRREVIKKSGELANATILEVSYGRGAVYSGGNDNNLVSQHTILKLEVRPQVGSTYITEDHFMASAMDMMKLRPGCLIQVRVNKDNPQQVVSLPETVTAPANAPLEARANLAIANLIAQGGSMSPEDVRKAMENQGIHSRPMPTIQDDPKAKLEKLKEMLNAGLITPQEYETKKVEILARF